MPSAISVFPLPKADGFPDDLRSAPTATSGSPSWSGRRRFFPTSSLRSAGSLRRATRPVPASHEHPAPSRRLDARPGRQPLVPREWAGSWCRSRRDRPDHAGRRHLRVPAPDGRYLPWRPDGRPRRRPLVHRVSRRRDRPDHDRRAPSPSSCCPRTTSDPGPLTVGPDGDLWFTDVSSAGNGAIGRITTAGAITEFPLPAGDGAPGLTVGPDGDLWFSDFSSAGPA